MMYVLFLSFLAYSAASTLRKDGQMRENLFSRKAPKLQNIAAGSSFPTNPSYAILQDYSDSTCTTAIGGASYLLDVCMTGGSSSAIYGCSGGVATYTSYTDLACTFPDTVLSMNVSACNDGSQIISCGSDPVAYTSKFVTTTYYQQSSCSQIIGSSAFANNLCQADGVISTIVKWPKYYQYASTDCTGTKIDSGTIPTTCEVPGTQNLDDTIGYDAFYKVSYSSSGFLNLSLGYTVFLALCLSILQLAKN